MMHGNCYSRSLRLCVALFLSVAMMITFMPAFAFANVTPEEETKYLREITFEDNDAHIFSVDGKDGTVALDDMKLNVLDENKNVVPKANYELEIYATWWEDDEDKRYYPEGDEFGLVGNNKDSGFTEYVVRALAKGGDYDGETEERFYIMDKHSLEYICSDVEFQGGYQYEYAMTECCNISLKDLKSPVVTANDGKELTKGEHYTVNYYSKPNPFMRASDLTEEEKEDCLIGEADLNEEGNPKENGFYIAEIAGKDPYYGSHWISLNVGSGITMDPMPGKVFSGEDTEITLDFPAGEGDALEGGFNDTPSISLGYERDKDWYVFDSNSDNKGCFSYNESSKKLTLHGDKIWELAGENGWFELAISVDKEEKTVAYGQLSLGVSESEERYDIPEGRTMLPQWNDYIDGGFNAFIRNSSFPDGEDRWIEIESAEIVKSDPVFGDEIVLEIFENENGWDVRSVNFGTAEVQITYTDFYGDKKTAVLDYTVGDTVYNVELWSADNRYKGLPGTEIDLGARAEVETCKRGVDGDGNSYYYDYDTTDEDFTYEWEIVNGSDYAALSAQKGDSNTLNFAPMPEGRDWIDEEIDVKVTATDGNSDVSRTEDFWVSSDFYQVTPASIDENPDIGRSILIKPELWHYTYNADPEKISSADFICNEWNEEAINVEWSDDDEGFILTRLNDWDVNFRIIAVVDDIFEEQWYHLDEKRYEILFRNDFEEETGDESVYSDRDLTLTIDTSSLAGVDPEKYEITVEAGRFDHDSEIDEEVLTEALDNDLYKVSDDKKTITLYGKKFHEKYGDDWYDFSIRVTAGYADSENDSRICDAWCHIEYAHACKNHRWLTGVITKPTTTSFGYTGYMCWDCHERYVQKIKKLNTLTVKVSSKTFKAKNLKKKKATFNIGASNNKGKIKYTPNAAAKKAKIKVSAAGKVTVPKKCKKGTYVITVTAAGNSEYQAGSKNVTIKVK